MSKFCVSHYTIEAAPDNKNQIHTLWTRFVVLADLHNKQYGKDNKLLIEAIDRQKPEFVIVAGDMMIAKPGYSLDIAMGLIGNLAKKYPVYYGNGNHELRLRLYPDQYGDKYKQLLQFFKDFGVHYLVNESETIKIAGRELVIAGLDIDRKFYNRFKTFKMDTDYIEHEIGKKKDSYTVLIAHNPEYFDVYAKWGADLTLSGHIHGGMVWLPFLGGVVSPKIRLFPKYDAGLFKKNRHLMLLSRGLGMHTIPVRINNPAELIVVDLMKESE